MKKIYLTLQLMVCIIYVQSQTWDRFGGNTIATTEFIGSDALSLVPLSIRTNSNHPINIFTANSANPRAQFTIGNALFSPITPTATGAGLRFF